MREVIDGQAPLPVAQVCAPTLEELLSDHRTGAAYPRPPEGSANTTL